MFGKVVVAAFAGFRLLATRTRAVGVWAAAMLTSIAAAVAIAALARTGVPQTPVEPWRWARVVAVVLPMLIFNLCLLCAVHRAILRPSEQAWGYLRFGADELRMFVVGVLGGLVVLACWVVGFLGFVLMTTLGFPRLLAALIPAGLALFVAPRLVLFGATSFARRGLAFSEAWDLGGQHYWSLLIMCLLVGVIGVGLLLVQVVLAHLLPSAGASVPVRLILAVPNALIASLLDVVVLASAPAALLALKARPVDPSAIFD
jgi:hypothetical protein